MPDWGFGGANVEVNSGKTDLWHGCHKIGEEGSKIVPLGAPPSSSISYAPPQFAGLLRDAAVTGGLIVQRFLSPHRNDASQMPYSYFFDPGIEWRNLGTFLTQFRAQETTTTGC